MSIRVINDCLLLLDGGAETTRTVIARTIIELAARPDQYQLLRDGADMTVATEEFIRFVTPILNMCRVANRDYELRGTTIRKGQQVVLMYPSANRDPAHFVDPERFDVTRTPNQHLAFGFGTHFCLGAALARLEIRLFFEEFVRRVREVRVVPGSVDYLANAFVNGVNRAEVELVLDRPERGSRMYDVKITNGTIVDGTGAARFTGDVAVKDGVIVAVSESTLDGDAAETIDATGLLVTPGFVDIHTHYDGQATWDPLLEPSSGHGVTTVVAGNCGVGFAPVRPGDEQWLISLMEGVEDIPGTALAEGIDWSWETFPEYLDALDRREFGIDVGVQVSHGAVRAYAMGERGAANEPATPDEIAAMAAIVQEAVEAGALGFSTSRTLGHRAMDGRPVPGTFAAEDELFALGRAMKAGGRAVFELAPLGAAGEDLLAPEQEMGWMVKLSDDLDLPVSFTLLQIDAAPDAWRGLMDESLRAHDAGAQVVPQIAARPFGMLLGFPDPARLQRPSDVPQARGAPHPRRVARRTGPSADSVTDSVRGRRRSRPDGAVRRLLPARAGFARPSLRARRPAGLRTDARPHDRGDGRGGGRRPDGDALRRHARARCAAPAHAAVLQLRRAQPRRHPRDAAAPGWRVGAVRRWRALRSDLRRVDPDVHAHALGP